MAAQTIYSGAAIAREAIRNTGRGERTLYGLLVSGGMALIVIGWRTEVHGWATSHPYFVGLLIGATGFCFGVPVAGVVVKEITRRTSESAERRRALSTVIGQLDYLDRLIEGLSPGPVESASRRLRDLALSAQSAAPRASANAKESKRQGRGGVRWWVLELGGTLSESSLDVEPIIDEKAAGQLRGIVQGDALWASVGFGCGRLGSDVTRLVSIMYPPGPSQQVFPGWFDELTSALQTLFVLQLPVHRRWLPAAVKKPPAALPVAVWSLQPESSEEQPKPSEAKPVWGILQLGGSVSQKDDSVPPEVKNAAQERATNELSGELSALAHHLEALATLVDAADRCRGELRPVQRH